MSYGSREGEVNFAFFSFVEFKGSSCSDHLLYAKHRFLSLSSIPHTSSKKEYFFISEQTSLLGELSLIPELQAAK